MKYLVIGLGNLGRAIAKDLTRVGNEVIGVDMDLHRVDMLKNDIAGAVALDSTDKEALSTLPLSEMDAIIVTFGKDFGTSVQTVALLKSQDAGKLIVRAISSIHETVIRAIGVSEIITPEKDFSTMYTSQASLGGLFRHWYKVTDTEHLYKIRHRHSCRANHQEHRFRGEFRHPSGSDRTSLREKEPDRAHTDRIQGYQPYHRGIDDRGG